MERGRGECKAINRGESELRVCHGGFPQRLVIVVFFRFFAAQREISRPRTSYPHFEEHHPGHEFLLPQSCSGANAVVTVFRGVSITHGRPSSGSGCFCVVVPSRFISKPFPGWSLVAPWEFSLTNSFYPKLNHFKREKNFTAPENYLITNKISYRSAGQFLVE